MLKRTLLVLLGLGAMTLFMGLHAQEAAKPVGKSEDPLKTKQKAEELSLREQILTRRFDEFLRSLLRLKQRLARGNKEDQLRAKLLEEAMDLANKNSTAVKFKILVDTLKNKGLDNPNEAKEALQQSRQLAKDLNELLVLIRQDVGVRNRREQRLTLEKLVKELEKIIIKQKMVQARTEGGKANPRSLKQDQGRVTDQTKDLIKKLGGKGGKGDGKVQIAKATPKSQGKGEGKKGKGKSVGKGGKENAGKGKSGDKKGDPSEAKGSKDGKGADGKGKDGKAAGKGKDGGKKGKDAGDAKSGGKKGDPKAGDSKSGSKDGKKAGDAKSGAKKGSKASN